jgi:hypothetical protein
MVSRQERLEKSVAAIAKTLAIMLKADTDSDDDEEDEAKKVQGDLTSDLDEEKRKSQHGADTYLIQEARGRSPNAEQAAKAAARDGISVPHFRIEDASSFLGPRLSDRAAAAAKAAEAANDRDRHHVATPPSMYPTISKAEGRSSRQRVADVIDSGVRANGTKVAHGEDIAFRQLQNALAHVEGGNQAAMTTVERLRGQLAI